jgi:general secretion pathway protein D
VTLDGDIIVTLNVESSSRGADVNIAGTNYPSFGTRRVGTKLRLRDGEPNLLAGLLREDERRSLRGFPGALRVPILQQLFSDNDRNILQTDIVMLLTPHIVRTSGLTAADLEPIYIGTQSNIGLGGPPPIITVEPDQPAAAPGAPAAPPALGASTPRPPAFAPGAPPTGQAPQLPPGSTVVLPPGSTPVPGTVVVPAQPPAAPPQPALEPQPPAPAPAPPPGAAATPPAAPAPEPPVTTASGFGLAQIVLSPPATFRVGGGPYTVPISVTNASRLSTVTLTVLYDPKLLRVRTVQEGSFMRSGGANASFAQQVSPGRIDITIVRASDATGATGTGLLAAVLFDALAPGTATLNVSGAASGPGGTPMGLQFRPVAVTVQQ